jgi:hypothetical protein
MRASWSHGLQIALGLFLVTLVVSDPSVAQDSATACRSEFGQIVRFDDSAKRAFVVSAGLETRAAAKRSIRTLEMAIRHCRPEWENAWNASFFSRPKYAGYKTDAVVQKYVEDGTWGKAYLAEYDASSKRLTMWPLGNVRHFQLGLQ